MPRTVTNTQYIHVESQPQTRRKSSKHGEKRRRPGWVDPKIDHPASPEGESRLDWSAVEAMWLTGIGATEIARTICPNDKTSAKRVRDRIYCHAYKHGWTKRLEKAHKMQELADKLLEKPKTAQPTQISPVEQTKLEVTNGAQIAANIMATRKEAYLQKTSKAIDKATELLEKHEMHTLEDAGLAFAAFEPVHKIAKDVHGLDAKNVTNAVQVNFLSQPGAQDEVIDA